VKLSCIFSTRSITITTASSAICCRSGAKTPVYKLGQSEVLTEEVSSGTVNICRRHTIMHSHSQHQRTSFGKRLRADLDVLSDPCDMDMSGQYGENETGFTHLRVPVPLRVRSFDHNVESTEAKRNQRASIPSCSIFLPLPSSPRENPKESGARNQQRLMCPMDHQPRQSSLKMRARRITDPATREDIRNASTPSPRNELNFESCLEKVEYTTFRTPKPLAIVYSKWSPPAPPVASDPDDVTLDEIPPSVFLPMFDKCEK